MKKQLFLLPLLVVFGFVATVASAHAFGEIMNGVPLLLATVTVTASDADAAEAGLDEGSFTVTRTGLSMILPLTVHYTLGGTADNGVDYEELSGSVPIPAGAASADITVTPIDDANVEGDETVVLTLSADLAYNVGSPNSATVTIADNDEPKPELPPPPPSPTPSPPPEPSPEPEPAPEPEPEPGTQTVLFSDDFEESPQGTSGPDDFPKWDNAGNRWDAIHSPPATGPAQDGTVFASVKGPADNNELRKAVSTEGFSDITLRFWYRIEQNLEVDDRVVFQWSSDGTTWNQLAEYANLPAGEWTERVIAFPTGAADISAFQFRWFANLSDGSDDFWLDTVVLEGTAL